MDFPSSEKINLMRSSFMLVYVQKQDVEIEDSLIGGGGLRRVCIR